MDERRGDATDHRLGRLPRSKLQQFVYHSGMLMKPIFAAAQRRRREARSCIAEGEEERVLRAVQVVSTRGSPSRSSSAGRR